MKYQQIIPAEQLQQYVLGFGATEGNVPEASPKTFKSLVDAYSGIVFLENPSAFSENANAQSPHLFLHGMSTTYFEKIVKDKGQIISINLKPTAIKSLFGIDANEMTNTFVDLSLVSKTNLAEQLLNTASTKRRIDLLNSFLLENLHKNKKEKTDKTHYVLDLLQQGNPEASLQKIQTELSISERSLERMFKENVGISPKLFSRIIRFQKALSGIRSFGFSRLTEIAYTSYYADQSHFIREFKEFAGVSPRQYIRQKGEGIEDFFEWEL